MEEYYIGIDLGGTRIKIGLVSNDKIISKKIISAIPSMGLRGNLSAIEKTVHEMIMGTSVGEHRLAGIAMGFPGLVDPWKKRILSTNKKYDDGPDLDIEKEFRKIWDVPFFIDNDARMAAVGEWKFGAGKQTDNLVLMMIGTGIGTSAIVEGKLLRGIHFQAGCLGGHFTVDYKGRLCTCGNKGCVEAYASTWSLRERMESAPGFQRSTLAGSDMDFVQLFQAAANGDVLAMEFVDDCIQVWSAAVVNLIHAYDPEVVVLGGGIMNNAAYLVPEITKLVHAHAWTPWGKTIIKSSELLSNAAILGAVYSLRQETIKNND